MSKKRLCRARRSDGGCWRVGMSWETIVLIVGIGVLLFAVLLVSFVSRLYFSKEPNDVHITGRRILATILDGLVLISLGYALMDSSFGIYSLAGIAYFTLVVLYYILLEGYLGQTLGNSMGSVADAYDNSNLPESFVSTLKRELIHRCSWPSRQVVRTAIFEYIEAFYNTRRRHSALGHLSPAEYEELRLRGGAAVA
jgi:hypothetical protein